MKLSLAAAVLGALAVSAQTSTECNPLKQSKHTYHIHSFIRRIRC